MVIVLPLHPRFAGLNPAEGNGFLRTIKIHSTISFDGEVKPSAPCHKILWHTKDPLRYDRDTGRQNLVTISRPVSPRFATRCLLQPEQITLADELELRWKAQQIRKWSQLHGMLCMIPPCNSYQ
jgi:hypothetical protein